VSVFSPRNVLSGATLLLGAAVIVGWLVRVPALVQVLPGLQAMVFATALSFLLTGCALLAPQIAPRWGTRWQSALGVAVVVVSTAMLIEQFGRIDLGVDLPALHTWLDPSTPHPGRMSTNSALAFFLIGATLCLMHRLRGTIGAALLGALICGVIAIGVTGLAGYLFGLNFIYNWYGYSTMAVHTAAGVVMAGVALLLTARDLPRYRVRIDARPDVFIAAIGAAWLTIVAFAAGIAGLAVMWQRAEQNLSDTLTLALRSRAQLFESLIDLRVDGTTYVVTRPQLVKQARALMRSPDDSNAHALLDGIANSFVVSGFSAIAFYDASGRQIAHSGTFASAPALRVPLKTRYEAELIWQDQLFLRVRARFADGDETLGTALTEQPLPTLTRSLTEVVGLGETGDGGLCAARGELMDCFPQRLRPRTFAVPRSQNGTPLPVARAVAGETGTLRAVDYRGKNVIAAFAPVGGLGLGMTLKMDTVELYAPVRERVQAFLPLLLALVVGGVLALHFQIRPLVTELLRSREEMRREVAARSGVEEELRRSNSELQNAISLKDRFLAHMSHDLRTPLNAIIGFTGTLLMRLPGPLTAEQEKQLKTVRSGAQHLHALINDLLDIATITSGKAELKPDLVTCQEVVAELVGSMRPLATAKGLELTINLPQAVITTRTDPRALKQILLNLIANAIKFTEQGTVSVGVDTRLEHGAQWIEFSVIDTGIGVRAEDQAKLFAAFTRVATAADGRTEGTGLGLHLSQQLANLLGGRIEFDSQYQRGSTFKLLIPRI